MIIINNFINKIKGIILKKLGKIQEGKDKRISMVSESVSRDTFQRWVSIDKAVYRSLYGSQLHGCI